MKVRAATLTAPRQIEMRTNEIPDEPAADGAILRVEGNGMCGVDWDLYTGVHSVGYPLVPGHEIVGRIEKLGPTAAARWQVKVGQRVAVKTIVTCGTCRSCRSGRETHCSSRTMYGLTPVSGGIAGGYADFIQLLPSTYMYPMSDELDIEDAVLFNPLSAGFDWAVRAPGTKVGDSMVIFGPGQRGLGAVVAAKQAGARTIIVVGRARRKWKLDLALSLGATHVINSEAEPVVDTIREITRGDLVDIAVDTTPSDLQPILDAIKVVRPQGTIVLAGLKGKTGIPGLSPDELMFKALTLKSVFSVSDWAREQAIKVLESRKFDFSRMHSHKFGIDQLDLACRTLGREVEGEDPLHITVVP